MGNMHQIAATALLQPGLALQLGFQCSQTWPQCCIARVADVGLLLKWSVCIVQAGPLVHQHQYGVPPAFSEHASMPSGAGFAAESSMSLPFQTPTPGSQAGMLHQHLHIDLTTDTAENADIGNVSDPKAANPWYGTGTAAPSAAESLNTLPDHTTPADSVMLSNAARESTTEHFAKRDDALVKPLAMPMEPDLTVACLQTLSSVEVP